MSLIKVKFESSLPPSMSDEEIKKKVEAFRRKNQKRKDNYKRKNIGFVQEEVSEIIEEEI